VANKAKWLKTLIGRKKFLAVLCWMIFEKKWCLINPRFFYVALTLTNLKNTHFELCKTPPPTPSSSHRCSLLVRKFCRLQKIRLIKTPIKIRLLKKNANASICISCLTFSQLTEPHIDSLKQKSWAEKEWGVFPPLPNPCDQVHFNSFTFLWLFHFPFLLRNRIFSSLS
jgi:hypothetical protein